MNYFLQKYTISIKTHHRNAHFSIISYFFHEKTKKTSKKFGGFRKTL